MPALRTLKPGSKPVGDQASKQSDIWPIENVWAIVKAKIDRLKQQVLHILKEKLFLCGGKLMRTKISVEG